MATVSGLCSPALVYLCFSIIHVLIDVYKQEFDSAFLKMSISIIITILLNILCERGLTVISWLLVLAPIMLITFTVVLLIYFLGFNPGQINKVFNVQKNTSNSPRYTITTRERFMNQIN